MNDRKIIIDLMMTNSCNKICHYCPINFDWTFLSKENIDYLIEYLDANYDSYDQCTINFFWWEPLLNFENIKYFIESNVNDKIIYTLWTNWILLTEEIIDYLVLHNIKTYLSFHADKEQTYKDFLKKYFLKKAFHLLQINFIVSPINFEFIYNKIDETVEFWFKNINIIPVMLTIKWEIKDLKLLKTFINYIDKKYINNIDFKWLNIYKFSYFDWIPVEVWFIVDTDLNIFQDSSDELYIWKQYSKLWNDLIKKIEDFSLLWNLKDEKILSFYLWKFDIKNIIKNLISLAEKLWYVNDYLIIHKIMNNYSNKRSFMKWNISDLFTFDK